MSLKRIGYRKGTTNHQKHRLTRRDNSNAQHQ